MAKYYLTKLSGCLTDGGVLLFVKHRRVSTAVKTTVTISVDVELWRRVKALAAELGLSASALVELALRAFLSCGQPPPQQPPPQPPSQPPPLSENQWVQVLRSRR